jgi:glycosyltransferase involved in cell wall biosynthesis
MACGLPTVASPVGVNADLVKAGVTGYLPRTTAEWSTALESLFQSPELAVGFGARAREQVEAHYCLAVTAPRFVAGVERALLPAGRRATPRSGVLRT